MDSIPPEPDEAQRAWLIADELLWRRAHEIVRLHPQLDPSGVYHTLNNLRRSPAERLRRGLAHGRLRAQRKRAAGRPKDLAQIPAIEEALATLESERDKGGGP